MTRLRAADAQKRLQSGHGRDFLEVLARSMHVIEVLGRGQHALTLSDVARAADLPKPSVRRVLHTLCSLGYAELAGRNFKLTPKIMRLATAYLGTGGNSRVLQSACDHLSQLTGQSCLAGVLDGEDVLVVAYSMPRQLMAPALGVGVHFPAYCTAAGRILLGQMPDEGLNAFLRKLRPVPQTEFTVTDKVKIKSQIITARKQGCSWMEDEFSLGWKTIAYLLRRHDGSVFGALSLNTKKSPAVTDAQLEKFGQLCAAQAAALYPLLV